VKEIAQRKRENHVRADPSGVAWVAADLLQLRSASRFQRAATRRAISMSARPETQNSQRHLINFRAANHPIGKFPAFDAQSRA
jgi:hypothetical protein